MEHVSMDDAVDVEEEREAFEAWHKKHCGYIPVWSAKARTYLGNPFWEGWLARAAVTPRYEYKLPSAESNSITVSNQTGKGAESQQACNLRSTSGVSAPEGPKR